MDKSIPWDKIQEKLGSWAEDFKPFYDMGGFEAIYTKLKEEGHKVKIVPEGKDLFKAFKECPKDKFKTMWMGQSPYYMIKGGVVVADGLAFSCGNTGKEQPSLELIYAAIEDDLYDGFKLDMVRLPDLRHLANQGVLLLNAVLTTPEGKAIGHEELWRPFIEYFLNKVLLPLKGIPCVFFGKPAQEYEVFVNKRNNPVMLVEHPSYANRQERPFKHEKLFSWTNEQLQKQGLKPIDWIEEPPF